MGKKLDLLLEIIRSVLNSFNFPENVSIDDNKVSVELSPLKKEQNITINGDIIVINTDTPEGKLIAEKVFVNAERLLNKDERINESEFSKLVADAIPYASNSASEEELLKLYKKFTPVKDIKIVESALFIRKLYEHGKSVEKYKALVFQQYGSRGGNITNLVTAKYFENYLLPIYEYLVKTEGDYGKKIFNEIYEEAVTQYPFAVFVSISKSRAQIKDEVIQKIRLNIASSVRILNIHGIGKKNTSTILTLLQDEDITSKCIAEPDIVQLENTIYVRIYF